MDNLSADEFFEYICTDKQAKQFYDEMISDYKHKLKDALLDAEALREENEKLEEKVEALTNHIIELGERYDDI